LASTSSSFRWKRHYAQDVYQQYRVGGKLDKRCSKAPATVKWRRNCGRGTPRIIFDFLVVRPTTQIDARQLAGRWAWTTCGSNCQI
jgi:hypothetical protein